MNTTQFFARARACVESVVGAGCFIVGAAILAVQPERSWKEIAGEPEVVTLSEPVEIEIVALRPDDKGDGDSPDEEDEQ